MQEQSGWSVYGVDFSGARLAGRFIWIARHDRNDGGWLTLTTLNRFDHLARSADWEPALAGLLKHISQSHHAVWGLDFPFALPIELFPAGTSWDDQLSYLASWNGNAPECGRDCVQRAQDRVGRGHVRRLTDREAKTPFDSYHYRIIYQLYFGTTKILDPLRQDERTAILPFQYDRWSVAERLVVESCPACFLKHQQWPHQHYKQSAGRQLTPRHRQTRQVILAGLADQLTISDAFQRVLMRDPSGDALDAVLAAIATAKTIDRVDHPAIANHPRYPHEGHIYT